MTSIIILLSSLALAQDGGLPAPAGTTTTTASTATQTTTTTTDPVAAPAPEPEVDCSVVETCTAVEKAEWLAWKADMEAWRARMSKPSKRTDALCLKVFGNKACNETTEAVTPPTAPVIPTQVVVTQTQTQTQDTTPPAPVEPVHTAPVEHPVQAPVAYAESDNGWQLSAVLGFAGAHHNPIAGVTAPGLMSANAGVKLHLDFGQHGFMSVQGGVIGGTDATMGWEGNLSIGGDIGRSLELGVMLGFYEYEVKGADNISSPYIKAKGYGQSVGVALTGTPSQKADWLSVTGYLSAAPIWGRVVSPKVVLPDFAPTVGVAVNIGAKARKSVVPVASAQSGQTTTTVTTSSTTTAQDDGEPTPWR